MNITILSQGECAKLIAGLGKLTHKVQDRIHQVAVSTLVHTRDHGDYTLAERLLNSLPNGQRVETLAKWFSVFSNKKLTFRKVNGNFAGKLGDRVPADFNIEGAAATPWGSLEKEKVQQEQFNVNAMLAYLRRKASDDKMLPDGSPSVHPEARALAARMLAFAAAGPILSAELTAESVTVAAPAAVAATTVDDGDDIANIVAELAA